LFFRYPNCQTGEREVRTPEQLIAAAANRKRFGFTSHKMKGGVFHPDYELECYRALAASLPGGRLRFDPNGMWSTEEAMRFGRAIEDLNNDYLEDPVFGLNGMRRGRHAMRVPPATNTVVVNFEQLAANVLDTAVDVILLDTTFWGGIRPCLKAAGVCETFQLGVAVHSSGELGTHASPRIHIRRGHVTWQVTGPRMAESFISASVLPRNDRGVVDWERVASETRDRFLRCHKRLWLEPVLIGARE
jgi:glucarate dehydratase